MNFDFMPELRSPLGLSRRARGDGRLVLDHLPLVPPARMAAGVSLLAVLLAAAGRRRRRAGGWPGGGSRRRWRPGVGPHLLPDPALEWLRRSYEALGVWVAELDPREEGPRAERIVDAERLSVAQIVAVDRRLERARDQEQSGVERMDSGIAGLPRGGGRGGRPAAAAAASTPSALALVEDDLRRLLDGVRRRPQVVELAQAQTQRGVARVGGQRRAPARLPARAGARRPGHRGGHASCPTSSSATGCAAGAPQVRVIGVSGRGDRRLLDTLLPEISELGASGARRCRPEFTMDGDPLGGVGRRPAPARRRGRCCCRSRRRARRSARWRSGRRRARAGRRRAERS